MQPAAVHTTGAPAASPDHGVAPPHQKQAPQQASRACATSNALYFLASSMGTVERPTSVEAGKEHFNSVLLAGVCGQLSKHMGVLLRMIPAAGGHPAGASTSSAGDTSSSGAADPGASGSVATDGDAAPAAGQVNPADVAATVAAGLFIMQHFASGVLNTLISSRVRKVWAECMDPLQKLLAYMHQQLAPHQPTTYMGEAWRAAVQQYNVLGLQAKVGLFCMVKLCSIS